jgi:hypothetical protein
MMQIRFITPANYTNLIYDLHKTTAFINNISGLYED